MHMNYTKSTPKRFAWLASAFIVILIIAVQFLPRGDHPKLRTIGVLILVSAAIFIFMPFHLLAKHGKTKAMENYIQAEKVVHHGLYSVLRHPQYLGYMLLAVGFALLSQHWVAVALTILGMICFYIQALQEEKHCLARFGEPYRRYLQRVPRFNLVQGIWRVFQERKK